MPKYLISYRKTEETGQKPEWAAFTCESELSLEAHAVKERVEKRMSVLGEKLWGNAEAGWLRSEEHTSELQSQSNLVCRLLLEKKNQRPGGARRRHRTPRHARP